MQDLNIETIHGIDMALGRFTLERLLRLEDSIEARATAEFKDLQTVIAWRKQRFPDGDAQLPR